MDRAFPEGFLCAFSISGVCSSAMRIFFCEIKYSILPTKTLKQKTQNKNEVKQNDYKNVLCDIRVLFFVVTVEQIIRWTNEGKERASLFVVL